jgi:hypothetical protein
MDTNRYQKSILVEANIKGTRTKVITIKSKFFQEGQA